MPARPNWSKSKAKEEICARFETGKLNPFDLPDFKVLKDSNPELFGSFDLKNFRQNIRNLAKKYQEKFPHLKFQTENMEAQFRSKFVVEI